MNSPTTFSSPVFLGLKKIRLCLLKLRCSCPAAQSLPAARPVRTGGEGFVRLFPTFIYAVSQVPSTAFVNVDPTAGLEKWGNSKKFQREKKNWKAALSFVLIRSKRYSGVWDAWLLLQPLVNSSSLFIICLLKKILLLSLLTSVLKLTLLQTAAGYRI